MTLPSHMLYTDGAADLRLAELASRMRPEPWRAEYRAALETAPHVRAMLHGPRCREVATGVRVLDAAERIDGCVVVLVDGETQPRRIARGRVGE